LNGVVNLLLVAGALLAVVALIQTLAARLTLPESTPPASASAALTSACGPPRRTWPRSSSRR
jgi:CPA1 family monovalent cation:H+ antiporter